MRPAAGACATTWPASAFRGVTSVRYFTNAADSRTEGVDATLAWRTSLGQWGDVQLTAAQNFNRTHITRISSTPPQITALGITTPLFDIIERTRLEHGQPRDKTSLGGNWKLGRFGFDLRATRYGYVEQVALTNQSAANVALAAQGATKFRTLPTQSGAAGNLDVIQRLEPTWLLDASVTGQITDSVSVTVGANNLLNRYPTQTSAPRPRSPAPTPTAFSPYSEFSPFGFSGGFYFARVLFSL